LHLIICFTLPFSCARNGAFHGCSLVGGVLSVIRSLSVSLYDIFGYVQTLSCFSVSHAFSVTKFLVFPVFIVLVWRHWKIVHFSFVSCSFVYMLNSRIVVLLSFASCPVSIIVIPGLLMCKFLFRCSRPEPRCCDFVNIVKKVVW